MNKLKISETFTEASLWDHVQNYGLLFYFRQDTLGFNPIVLKIHFGDQHPEKHINLLKNNVIW